MFRTASIAWSFAMALTLLGLPLLNNSLSLRADDRNDEPKEHTKDSLDKVQELITEKKAVLVDVRELVEWNDGHVKEAVLLPWRELQDKLKEDDVREKVP